MNQLELQVCCAEVSARLHSSLVLFRNSLVMDGMPLVIVLIAVWGTLGWSPSGAKSFVSSLTQVVPVNSTSRPFWEPYAYSAAQQYWPFWLGLSPLELATNGDLPLPTKQRVPNVLQALILPQVTELLQAAAEQGQVVLHPSAVGSLMWIEAWPTEDPNTGRWTMAYARYSLDTTEDASHNPSDASWQFLYPIISQNFSDPSVLTIVVPQLYELWNASQAENVFASFTQLDGLYDDPAYANCIFAQEPSNESDTHGWIFSAWQPALVEVLERAEARSFYANPQLPVGQRFVCYAINQPPWLNRQPVTWKLLVTLNVSRDGLPVVDKVVIANESDVIDWVLVNDTLPNLPDNMASTLAEPIVYFSQSDVEAWSHDVKVFSGELPLFLPISKTTFSNITHKNAADPFSQLPIVLQWLEERYWVLNISTRRDCFPYRNQTHCNLIAILPGEDAALPPILFMDHYDTAYDEDVFAINQTRVSAPGADDNGSAVATLLRAAALLILQQRNRTIWLVHITGEEYPSDDLGVRHLLNGLLAASTPIYGVILMDMIAWRSGDEDTIFQVNAAPDETSRFFAKVALESILTLKRLGALPVPLEAVYRSRLDPYSYLFNTDGDTIANLGFPVILLNEHINWYENFNRDCYHTSCDVFAQISVPYAASTVHSAIETLARLAGTTPFSANRVASPSSFPVTSVVIISLLVAIIAAAILVALFRRNILWRRNQVDEAMQRLNE